MSSAQAPCYTAWFLRVLPSGRLGEAAMEEGMTTAEKPAARTAVEGTAKEGAAPSKAAATAPPPQERRGPKLPKLDLPKPTMWDLVALVVLAVGVALTGANLAVARGVEIGSISGAATGGFVSAQLLVCLGGLVVLGKTAKEGTIWGNLFSVGACFVGMSGVLLASALWALA
jgi:hypothetical protein